MRRRFIIQRLFIMGFLVFTIQGRAIAAPEKCHPEQWKPGTSYNGKIFGGVDGDTAHIFVKGKNYSVRFLSIDTPETHFNGRSQGKWGELAAQYTQKLLPKGSMVRVELGEESCDVNGRLLAHLWIKDASGKELHINRILLEEGLAAMYCIYPNLTYCEEFSAVSQKAMAEEKGMFSDPSLMIPYEWRTQVRREKPSKYVGDIVSQIVYQPEEIKNILVYKRIFFFKFEDIHYPYRMVH